VASLLLLACSLLVNGQLVRRLRCRNRELQSARGALERERQKLRQKLRTSLTAATVAHEINQPLSTILLNGKLVQTQLLPEGPAGIAPSNPALEDFLTGLVTDVERVVRIIEKMRSLLRNVQTDHRPVSMGQVVDSCLLYLKQPLEASGVEVRCRGLAEPCWIAGDADQLQVAVSNLLRNACEALAERVRKRHRLVVDLLVAVGVPADSAEADAEGIEHHVSDVALSAFRAFLARG
jgi:signal transduction histidine kinase